MWSLNFFLFLFLCPLLTFSQTLPSIPSIDKLGAGYDARYGDRGGDSSFRTTVFQLSYDQNLSVKLNGTLYASPDYFAVKSLFLMDPSPATFVFNTSRQVASFLFSGNPISTTNTMTRPPQTPLLAGMYCNASLSQRYWSLYRLFNHQYPSAYAPLLMTQQYYTFEISPDFSPQNNQTLMTTLSPAYLKIARSLPEVFSSDTYSSFASFFMHFGTHAFIGGKFGGALSFDAQYYYTYPQTLPNAPQMLHTIWQLSTQTTPLNYSQSITLTNALDAFDPYTWSFIGGSNSSTYANSPHQWPSWLATVPQAPVPLSTLLISHPDLLSTLISPQQLHALSLAHRFYLTATPAFQQNKWEQLLPSLPIPNSFGGAVTLPDAAGTLVAYLVGGAKTPLTYRYDPVAATITALSPLPTPRSGLGVVNLNGLIYAVGGYAFPNALQGNNPLRTVEIYNAATDSWQKGTSLHTARYSMAVASVGGKIYAIGGISMRGAESIVEIFDPVANNWTLGTPMPINLCYSAVAVAGTDIYVMGGITGKGPYPSSPPGNYANTNAIYIYHTLTDSWTLQNNSNINIKPFSACNAVTIGPVIFGFFNQGVVGSSPAFYQLNTSQDPRLGPPGVWQSNSRSLNPMPANGCSVVSINDIIYSFGGYFNPNVLALVQAFYP